MVRTLVIGSALLLASTAPALATGAATTPEAAAGDPSRKTCRSILKTGSRLGVQKVCKTVDEWTEHDKANKRDTDEAINRTRGNCSGPGCE